MNQRPRKHRVWQVIIAAAVFLAAAALFLPTFSKTALKEPLIREWGNLKRLGDALCAHAGSNDGKFPARLQDLIPESLDAELANLLKFHDLKTREPHDWIYYPGHAVTNPPDTIVVASPGVFSSADGTQMVGEGAFRVVWSADKRITLLKDVDFAVLINEQQQPAWLAARANTAKDDPWRFVSNPVWSSPPKHSPGKRDKKPGDAKTVAGLIKSLREGEGWTRNEAAEDLGEIGAVTSAVVPALVEALNARDVGYSAAQALASISLTDTSVVPTLIETLQAGKKQASYWAICALGEIGPEGADAVPLLVDALRSDSDDKHIEAAKALAVIGPEAKTAVPSLIGRLNEADHWTCKCATIALGRIGPEAREAIPRLGERFDARADYWLDAARALWKIDPGQSSRIVPSLIATLEKQRRANGTNEAMDNNFFSAIELLGEIGPEARAAIPILRVNLQGGARFHAAWALWRIDPTLADTVTPILTGFFGETARNDRLDRFAQGSNYARHILRVFLDRFVHEFDRRMAAAGALWQIHPGKRAELKPVIVALLREWETQKVLNKLTEETSAAIPALRDILDDSSRPELQLLSREALRRINTTDPGW